MDNQALKPNNLFNEFSNLVKEPEKDTGDNTDEEKALSYIAHFKGWQIVKEYKDMLFAELDNFVTQSIENGASSKEVGERTIAKEIAKAYVGKLISKVEDARDAVERKND